MSLGELEVDLDAVERELAEVASEVEPVPKSDSDADAILEARQRPALGGLVNECGSVTSMISAVPSMP